MTIPSPPRLRLARLPTPLEPLDRLHAELGGPRIWVKRDDLTEGVAGGNKLRKLEYSLGQAVAEGADVVITAGASQSNHCRQTAFAAARLGLGCHLVLAGEPPAAPADGNLLLDQLLGAEISYAGEEAFERLPDRFEELCRHYRSRGATPFCIPVGATNEIGLWGYIEAARELVADLDREGLEPSHVVAAVGSGGTQAGLGIGARLHGLDAALLGVSVSRPSGLLDERIDGLVDRWCDRYDMVLDGPAAQHEILDGYIEPGYGRADQGVYDTIRRIARLEGLVFDPVYTGKAFDALLQEIEAGRFDRSDDVVFLHTGGIYGVFPHRARLATSG